MAISSPLTLPAVKDPATIEFSGEPVVGMSRSPFTGSQQTYDWNAGWLEGVARFPPMKRANAEEWVAFLLSCKGVSRSFLLGDWINTSPRGSWVGSPLVNGAHAARAESIALDGFTPSGTNVVRKGDWVQFGSGSTSRLHKSLTDANANGSGQATLEIWPPLRAALADNAAIVTSSPKGLFMLKANRQTWSIGLAQIYGLQFEFMEDLRDI